MNGKQINEWWAVAAAAVPIFYDLALEPYRIGAFIFFCFWFGFIAALIRIASKNDWGNLK